MIMMSIKYTREEPKKLRKANVAEAVDANAQAGGFITKGTLAVAELESGSFTGLLHRGTARSWPIPDSWPASFGCCGPCRLACRFGS